MKIALVGYGKMGKEIEKILIEKGHQVSFKINSTNTNQLEEITSLNTDVAIEFTRPDAALSNIQTLLKKGVKVVTGTTGWYDQLDQITQWVEEYDTALFYASNFSVGVNVLFRLNEYLAEIMNEYPEYDVSMMESHHLQKLDSPSGTAITLAEQLLERIQRKSKWEETSNADDSVMKINALRQPEVKGTHIVRYESDIDSLEIKHIAKNRKGFALGAVQAAEFVADKQGVFTMRDLI